LKRKKIIKKYQKLYKQNNKEKIKEYYNDNKDEIKNKQKDYYNDNKDEIKNKQKDYYNDNKEELAEQNKEIIICCCGKQYTKCNKTNHKRTKFHLSYINSNKESENEN
jgi:hypothetical protein